KRIVLRRRLDHDQLYIFLLLETGTLIDIERVREKVKRDRQLIGKVRELLLFQRRKDIHPGPALGMIDLDGLMVDVLKELDHRSTPPSNTFTAGPQSHIFSK